MAKYIEQQVLQSLLTKMVNRNDARYLLKGAQAASAATAAKVDHSLKITVGDTEVSFDGSSEQNAPAAAAKVHKHDHTDINDFTDAVKAIVNDGTTGTIHTHSNLEVLEGISAAKVTAWDGKIGTTDANKLAYENDGMSLVTNVKDALDVLVKNVQVSNAALSNATASVDGLATRLTAAEGNITQAGKDIDALETKVADLEAANAEGGAVANAIADAKKAGTDAQAAVEAEAERAKAAEKANADAIAAINDTNSGLLAQAKTYADQQDAILDGKITTAQAQADKGVADAAAEATRAKGVEQELRADLGTKADPAAADGSAFARIAQVKADLAAEAQTARAAEKEAKDAAVAAQADVDALEVKVGDAADTADDATVYGAIAAEKARAIAAEEAVDEKAEANKAAISTLNGADTVEGSVAKKIKDAIANVNTTTEGLDGRIEALEGKVGSDSDVAAADGTLYARVAKNAADIDAIEADYLKAADKTELANAINTEKGRLDSFLAAADLKDGAIDTLKEIQDYITTHGAAADEMVKNIAANKTAIDAINNETTGILVQAKKYADDQDAAQKTVLEGAIATAKQEAIDAAAADATSKVGAAKTELQASIDKKADQTALQAEIERAQGAEAANKAVLDKLDGSVNTDGSVKNQIEAARATLQGNIDAKVAQTDYNAKVKELEDADTALSERIAKFEGDGAGSVAAQVKAVADDLKAHKAAQVTKEAEVDGKLDVIQGEGEGSIKKALADAKTYADAEDDKIEALLGTKENTADDDTAFGRIAKEVARATAAEGALADRAKALEDKVGDDTKGLVKDVAALKTTVGDASAGLVKDVADLKQFVSNHGEISVDELDAMLDAAYGVTPQQ